MNGEIFARIMEVVGVCAASLAVMKFVVWLDTPIKKER